MTIVSLNKKLKRVEFSSFEIENDIVLNYFDRIPLNERDDILFRAIYIGVLALMEDRISAFLSKTSNELGTELESLKMIFEMKKELFYKTSVKGILAEDDIATFLNNFFKEKNLKDTANLTGSSAGILPMNKTGDIVCFPNGSQDLRITIECKFDKSIKLGEIESKEVFSRKTDTAWSQLIEADANRDSRISLIVFDLSLVDASILRSVDNIGYIPSIGFIAIIDTQRGDYSNLAIAYMLARDIALNAHKVSFDKDLLSLIVNRLLKAIADAINIKSLVVRNIENNREILKQLEKNFLLMEFNQQYLMKFLKDGNLSKQDLLNFYMGDEIRQKYIPIEKEINSL